MIKTILIAATIFLTAGAINPAQAQRKKQVKTATAKKDVKFLDEISTEPIPASAPASDPKSAYAESLFTSKRGSTESPAAIPVSNAPIENAGTLQFKYALLLDTEVEQVSNLVLFAAVDQWLGTRYRLGGSTRDGIDCSALMQSLYTTLYGISIPRTAREQYAAATKISRTELREGDLIFFNTIGGVSHVGMYLQNNKFVHASSGGGVTISDMYEEYWMKKFIGAGRIETAQLTVHQSNP